MAITYAPTGEATYTFATAKNFVSSNIASLTFYYYPDKGNSPALLYAKLTDSSNNSSVASLTDVNVVDYSKGWAYLPIAISQFVGTADLNSIKKVSIGVTAGSGSGKVEVDTIILHIADNFGFSSRAAGDFDLSSVVDFNDFALLARDWMLSGKTVTASAVSAANLLFQYEFEEGSGTTAVDSSGNGYDATMSRPGGFDAAGGIGGSGAWYSLDGSLNLTVPPGAVGTIDKQVTVAVWIKANVGTLPRQSVICLANASAPLSTGIFSSFGWLGNDAISAWVSFWTSYIAGVPEKTSYWPLNILAVEGQWVHVALVKDVDNGFQRIYINGEMVAENSNVTVSLAPLTDFTIGNRAALDRGIIGRMDDFRCYNRALSQGEIVTLAGKASVYQPLLKSTDMNGVVYWGSTSDNKGPFAGMPISTDTNGDDTVDFRDIAVLTGNWLDVILWP